MTSTRRLPGARARTRAAALLIVPLLASTATVAADPVAPAAHPVTQAAAPAAQAAERLALADAAFAAADWEAASRGYRVLVGANPADGRSWFRLGIALQTLGDQTAALAAYEGLLENDPAGPFVRQALLRMARVEASRGNHDDALALLERFASGGAARPALVALEAATELDPLRDSRRYGAVALALTPCATPEYRQFDFWLGTWEVYGPSGQLSGRNVIEPTLGGCAVHESWSSAGGNDGYSYNFYDASDGKWHQSWIDNNGAPLYLAGGLEDDRMVLSDGVNRVTWTPLPNGHVRQHWETTADGGATWATVFDGEYRPAGREH